MLGTDEARHQIAAAIMRRLATGPTNFLQVTGEDGDKPIMVAFDDEKISAVFERISWSGGYSNLVVVGNGMSVVSVLPASSAVDESAGEALLAAEIHQDASIGMLVSVAKEYADGLRIPVNFGTTSGDVLAGAVPITTA